MRGIFVEGIFLCFLGSEVKMVQLVGHHRKALRTQTIAGCNLLAGRILLLVKSSQNIIYTLTFPVHIYHFWCIKYNRLWVHVMVGICFGHSFALTEFEMICVAFETRAPDWRQSLSTQNKLSCLISDCGAPKAVVLPVPYTTLSWRLWGFEVVNLHQTVADASIVAVGWRQAKGWAAAWGQSVGRIVWQAPVEENT